MLLKKPKIAQLVNILFIINGENTLFSPYRFKEYGLPKCDPINTYMEKIQW